MTFRLEQIGTLPDDEEVLAIHYEDKAIKLAFCPETSGVFDDKAGQFNAYPAGSMLSWTETIVTFMIVDKCGGSLKIELPRSSDFDRLLKEWREHNDVIAKNRQERLHAKLVVNNGYIPVYDYYFRFDEDKTGSFRVNLYYSSTSNYIGTWTSTVADIINFVKHEPSEFEPLLRLTDVFGKCDVGRTRNRLKTLFLE